MPLAVMLGNKSTTHKGPSRVKIWAYDTVKHWQAADVGNFQLGSRLKWSLVLRTATYSFLPLPNALLRITARR